ncbi:response regulator [Desulfogranum japonicum]|uniref:response regulator n=1 Tax=Desulfogranum japonicum TaxID=231447 RepID=UPI00040B8715|nr:response regulator [Desulfogranum japonicum]
MSEKDTPDSLTQKTGHALYNIFSTIRANAEMVIEDSPQDARNLQRLQRIIQACVRGEKLVGQARHPAIGQAITEVAADTVSPMNGKVLVVDNEPEIAELISRYLRKENITAVPFYDSKAALRRFLQQPEEFALVITDYDMPDLTGVELAQNIRQADPALPVILISGIERDLSRRQLVDLGIVSIVYKPIETKKLLEAVDKALPGLCLP